MIAVAGLRFTLLTPDVTGGWYTHEVLLPWVSHPHGEIARVGNGWYELVM